MGILIKIFELVVNFVEMFVSNPNFSYGLAIVLMTLLIKVIFLPLDIWQQKSMGKMTALTPKVKEIQARYKDDQEESMSQMRKLYKANNTSQFSGCIPILIQLPLLGFIFQLFRSLSVDSVVGTAAGVLNNPGMVDIVNKTRDFYINGVSFLWIPDLASKDPYYILPILTFVTTILGQFVNQNKKIKDPSGPNPMTTNLIMGGVMAIFTSGVTATIGIYWVLGNIFRLFFTWLLKVLKVVETDFEIVIPEDVLPNNGKNKNVKSKPIVTNKKVSGVSSKGVTKSSSNPYIKIKSSDE